MCEGEYINV